MSMDWLIPLRKRLALSRPNGTLLFVESAPEYRLRDALLTLADSHPTLEVYSSIEELEPIAVGATYILCVQPKEIERLKLHRGFFRERRHTVIFWASAGVAAEMRSAAFDLLDVMSHVFQCSEEPGPYLVANLRAAVQGNAKIVWDGPMIGSRPFYSGLFEAAFPGKKIKWCNTRATYQEIKRQVEEAQGGWLFCFNIETSQQLTLLEAAIEGLAYPPVLVWIRNPNIDRQISGDGWWPAYQEPMHFLEARRMLAGRVSSPGRLVSLTGLERDAVFALGVLLDLGVKESELDGLLRKSEDPGVALARFGPMKNDLKNLAILNENASPLALRAFPEELSRPAQTPISKEELARTLLEVGVYFAEHYDDKIGHALLKEAREYSAKSIPQSSALDPDELLLSASLPQDFYAAAKSFMRRGEYERAISAFQRAISLSPNAPPEERVRYRLGLMNAQRLSGWPEEALANYTDTLPLTNHLPKDSALLAELQWERGWSLIRAKKPHGFSQLLHAVNNFIRILGEDSETAKTAAENLSAFYQMSQRAIDASEMLALRGTLLSGGLMEMDWIDTREAAETGATDGEKILLAVDVTSQLGQEGTGELIGRLWLHAVLLHPSGAEGKELSRWLWATEIVVDGVIARIDSTLPFTRKGKEPSLEGRAAEEVYLALEGRTPPTMSHALLSPASPREELRELWSRRWGENLSQNRANQPFVVARQALFLLLRGVGGGYLREPLPTGSQA